MEEFRLTPFSCVLVLLMTIMFWLWKSSESRKKKLVGYVSEIRTHPVKSAKPLHHDEIEVSPLGVKHDRYVIIFYSFTFFKKNYLKSNLRFFVFKILIKLTFKYYAKLIILH